MSEPRVVVGVDNSEGSHRAVHWAADEALRTGRKLVLINVYDWRVPGGRGQLAGGYAESLREVAQEVVDRAVKDAAVHTPGASVLGETVIGSAGGVLAASSADDLVVIGNRGRGGFASLMLGSVGHHVAAHTKGTVVVVRGRPDAESGPVVVGVDEGGEAALRQGFEEAHARGTGLVAVHVYRPVEVVAGYGVYLSTEDAKERHEVELAALREKLDVWAGKYPDVAVETFAVEGHPTAVLVGLSRTAQLVVVGHRATTLGTGVGAVAAQLLHHAECPVMITRSEQEHVA